jgi:ATP-dependent Lon protease
MPRQESNQKGRAAVEGWIAVLPVRDIVQLPSCVNTLQIVREPSRRALRKAQRDEGLVLVLSQRDMALETPGAKDLARVGTLSEILQVVPLPDGSLRVALKGLRRAKVVKLRSSAGGFSAVVEGLQEIDAQDAEVEALQRDCASVFSVIVQQGDQIPAESIGGVVQAEGPAEVADLITHHLPLRHSQKQELLEQVNVKQRLTMLRNILERERQIQEIRGDLQMKVEADIANGQRTFYLREQLKALQRELAEGSENESELYRERIEQASLSPEARDKAMIELARLERTPATSPECVVLRNYLDWLLALPWDVCDAESLDLDHALSVLEEDHFGLVQVKDRVLDYLALRQLSRGKARAPILCFAGPPGVGKTSTGRSIARAMGRRFIRISLGGVRDEAEIRGHRRTYVGSMPGRIIQSLRTCGCRNPVLMLDEIDKLASDYRGDPMSALLEVLDPEQNARFSDHYIEVPFDLSAVTFIATANLVEHVPPALRDRMEVIHFPSYTEEEKVSIAASYLVPRQLEELGLGSDVVSITEPALVHLIRDHTREAGVRELERQISALVRKSARSLIGKKANTLQIDEADVEHLLGRPRVDRLPLDDRDAVGAATGLVVTECGGEIITIEASLLEPVSDVPTLSLTGNLGDVMKESCQAAVSYLRSVQHNLSEVRAFRHDVHIHVPQGAIPKEGPSAGLTALVALASAFTGRCVRREVALTGELTLRGKVLPVGGVREKILAAHRSGLREVVVPAGNAADLDDVPQSIRESLVIHTVSHADEALRVALSPSPLAVVQELLQ